MQKNDESNKILYSYIWNRYLIIKRKVSVFVLEGVYCESYIFREQTVSSDALFESS